MQKYADLLNLIVAGLLGLLWFDIRNVRKEREDESRKNDKALTDMKSGMYDVFMTEIKHALLCENAGLKIKEHISTELKAMEGRILKAINKGSANDQDTA